jgi:hypothetical protein
MQIAIMLKRQSMGGGKLQNWLFGFGRYVGRGCM